MRSASAEELVRNEIYMCTKNPWHESEEIEWSIDNFTDKCRLGTSSEYPLITPCRSKFRLVAEFKEKYHSMMNFVLKLQREDDSGDVLHIDLDLKLISVDDDVYSHKVSGYTCPAQNKNEYNCFSEVFTTRLWRRMIVPTSFSYQSEPSTIDKLKLHAKKLIGSFGSDDCIYILLDDKLVVKGKIKFYGCCLTTFTRQTHTLKLLEDFRVAFENCLYTDIELHVGEDVIHVHRFVLSVRSPVFKNMLERDMRENRTSVIKITGIQKQVLDALVWYMYTGTVRKYSWSFHCELYSAAHFYELPFLQETIAHVLELQICNDTACKILGLASLYGEDRLKKCALNYIVRYFVKFKPTAEWEWLMDTCPSAAFEILEMVSSRYG